MQFIVRWPFIIGVFVLPIVNIFTGTPLWSIVAIWSMWIVWSMLFSPQLVEYNRISNVVRLITNVAILLVLIDVFIASGWAIEVVAIVGFSGLGILSILFFSNLHKQRQNLFPMLLFIIVAIGLAITGIILWRESTHWSIITLATTGGAFLLTTAIVLRKDLLNEFAKRFHIK
ncbi:MAG: DUF6320 domain-containing protein [Bacilli bacterium]